MNECSLDTLDSPFCKHLLDRSLVWIQSLSADSSIVSKKAWLS